MNCRRITQGRAVRPFPLTCCIRAAGMILCAVIGTSGVYAAESDHDNIRWDLIHVNFSTTPVTLTRVAQQSLLLT